MAAATLTSAQAEAMKTAAGNEGGAMMGFMGLNMAQMAGGMNAGNLYQMAQQRPAPAPAPAPVPVAPAAAPAANGWTCKCGAVNTGKFCTECGSAQVVGWTCACGSVNKGKFCPECGAKKPEAAPLYRCDKCGWEPEDPKNPPRFCPECGDKFDEGDVK
jgi:membrane protease subunit (stomatin/prohibitin family)